MNTPDHPAGPVPAWPPAPLPAVPPLASWDEPPPEAAPPPAKAITPQTVARAARRHWWQILLIWGVGSAVLMALAYTLVKPSYDAVAWLQVNPPPPQVIGPWVATTSNEGHMETQVQLIASP